MIRPRLVGGVEIARFSRRLERANDHSCRIRAQIKTLPVENLNSNEKSFE
jgi:phosphate uptake regulator